MIKIIYAIFFIAIKDFKLCYRNKKLSNRKKYNLI